MAGIASHDLTKEHMVKKAIALVYSNYLFEYNYTGVIWFLTCLFITELLFFVIQKFVKNRTLRIATILTLGILGFAWSSITSFLPPFFADKALTALLFYSLGFLMRGIPKKESSSKEILVGLVAIVIGSVLGMYNQTSLGGKHVDMLYLRYGNPVFFVVAAGLCLIGFLYIFHGMKEVFEKRWIRPLNYIGKNSLVIFSLHIMIMQVLEYVVGKTGLQHGVWVVLTFSTLLISMLAAAIINKFFHKVVYLR